MQQNLEGGLNFLPDFGYCITVIANVSSAMARQELLEGESLALATQQDVHNAGNVVENTRRYV